MQSPGLLRGSLHDRYRITIALILSLAFYKETGNRVNFLLTKTSPRIELNQMSVRHTPTLSGTNHDSCGLKEPDAISLPLVFGINEHAPQNEYAMFFAQPDCRHDLLAMSNHQDLVGCLDPTTIADVLVKHPHCV